MASGFPDWTRAIVLLGWDGTNFIPVLLDEDGNLNVLMRGEDALGDLHMVRVDADGQIIMVPRGASGHYLDVDAAGFMTAVIKGNYEGDLITVKADDQGRLSAFVVDSVDAWGNLLKVGNAELAARLGSLMSYDGRGQYQFGYDFRNGLTGWNTAVWGTGAQVVLTPEAFERGGYSVSLTAGSDGSHAATTWYHTDIMESDTIGVEAGISIAGSIDSLRVLATVYDGDNYHTIGLQYDDVNDRLHVREPGPTWTQFEGSYQMYHNANAFHIFKIVADISTGKYVRALIAGHEFDVSAYDVLTGASATRPYIDFAISLTGRLANNDAINLDYVVITNQE